MQYFMYYIISWCITLHFKTAEILTFFAYIFNVFLYYSKYLHGYTNACTFLMIFASRTGFLEQACGRKIEEHLRKERCVFFF
uniref:Uncharacterized protein n=1 Tax=Amblyomma triste TaxID=251400 RepID=A0A023G1F2_AMBTT